MFKVFRLSILCSLISVVSVFAEHVRPVSAIESEGQTLDFNQAEQKSHDSALVPDNIPVIDLSEIASQSLPLNITTQEPSIGERNNFNAQKSLQTATQVNPVASKVASATVESAVTLPVSITNADAAPATVVELTASPVASPTRVDLLTRPPVNSNPMATIPAGILGTITNVPPVSNKAVDLRLTDSSSLTNTVTAPSQSIAQVESAVVVPNPYRQDGFYITTYGIPIQGRGFAQDFIGRATFDNDYGLGAAVGYRYRDYRLDLEYSYFTNNFKELFFFNPGTTTVAPNQPETSPGASVTGQAYMLNAYYDIPVGSEQFRPYIGAGIGFYNARINNLSPPGFQGFVANGGSPDRFAYQLRAGVNYAVARNFEIFTGYRFFQGNTFEYTIENSGNPPLVLRPNGLKSDSWEVGLRYTF